jgi:hypothetical protein
VYVCARSTEALEPEALISVAKTVCDRQPA